MIAKYETINVKFDSSLFNISDNLFTVEDRSNEIPSRPSLVRQNKSDDPAVAAKGRVNKHRPQRSFK